MTRSMTGFGRAAGEIDGDSYTVELSAVNHRFFDCTVRLPTAWGLLESYFRDRLKAKVSRGKFYLAIRRDKGPGAPATVQCDPEVAKSYIDSARNLAHLMSSTDALSLNTLAQLEGVFYQEEKEQDLDQIKEALSQILDEAIANFDKARVTEGKALAQDTQNQIAQMRDAVEIVRSHLPDLQAAYTQRLRERMEELNTENGVAEERIAIELAMLAEKTDVNEELVRLETHFLHVEELIASKKAIGRELNFLAQEIQREINTLGSKIRDVDVVRQVVRMKTELEKLREQVQNIE